MVRTEVKISMEKKYSACFIPTFQMNLITDTLYARYGIYKFTM